MLEYSDEEMRKAYVEVLEVLKYIPGDEYYQIPKSVINEMKSKANRFYKFKFTNMEDLSRLACVIIVDLYTKYIADKEKKKIVIDILRLNEIKHKKDSDI